MSHSPLLTRAQRPLERASTRPVAADFVSQVRRLWVHHDPMRFVGDEGAAYDLYDHQAYVTALCADEILSEGDAEKIVTTMLRHEFGSQGAVWNHPDVALRVQNLARDLDVATQQRARRPASVAPPAR